MRLFKTLKCAFGFHTWKAALAMCGNDHYVRHGTRQCSHCRRYEVLMLGTAFSGCEWLCTEGDLSRLSIPERIARIKQMEFV